jgi:DHHC palmitoyltransferase
MTDKVDKAFSQLPAGKLLLTPSLKNCGCCKSLKKIGNNYVFIESASGEIVVSVGPHWPGVLATIGVIIGGTVLNFHIISQIHFRTLTGALISNSLVIFFCVSTTAALLLTACSDPGIARIGETPNDYERAESQTPAEELNDSRWCEICSIYQLENLRIRHCPDCNVCIMGLDHHCPWMGKCVGRKNMKWFVLFNILWMCYFIELMIMAFVISASTKGRN